MHQYLQETAFAAQSLFQLATGEGRHLDDATQQLLRKEQEFKAHQWDFQTSDLNEDFSDAYVTAAFGRAGRAAQEVERLKREVDVLQASVGTRQHSV